MVTNRDVLDLIIRLYDDKIGADPSAWDHLCTVDGSYSALKVIDDVPVLIWRGSETLKDWLDDFEHLAIPVDDHELGLVHPGFLVGERAVERMWDEKLGPAPELIVCGHSLGAGHAQDYSGHRCFIGLPPARIVVFGCPKAGFKHLSDLLAPVPFWNYKNQAQLKSPQDALIEPHHDLITDVPFSAAPVLDYVQCRQFIPVTGMPLPGDPWAPLFEYHHIQLYSEGYDALMKGAK